MSRSLSQREPQPQPAQAERIGYNYITAKERSMNVRGKVFVVTGAGNGIAREVTLQLLAKGARVAGVDLNGKGLEETAALATATATTTTTATATPSADRFTQHVVNITDREAVAALPAAVKEAHGQIDGLLNIAGVIQQFVKIIDLPFSEIEKVMNVNFWGVINTVKAFLPELIERPEAAILNVSSMGAYAPVPGQAAYGASKAAVRLLTEALYAELMDTNVAVTTIFPGAIATNIAQNSGVSIGEAAAGSASEENANGGNTSAGNEDAPTHKTTPAPEAARQIIEALEKGKFRATVGADATAMDRIARLSPKKATELIAKQMGDLLG